MQLNSTNDLNLNVSGDQLEMIRAEVARIADDHPDDMSLKLDLHEDRCTGQQDKENNSATVLEWMAALNLV